MNWLKYWFRCRLDSKTGFVGDGALDLDAVGKILVDQFQEQRSLRPMVLALCRYGFGTCPLRSGHRSLRLVLAAEKVLDQW